MATPHVKILRTVTDNDMTAEAAVAQAAIAAALAVATPNTLRTTWLVNQGVMYLIIEWQTP